jgi:hypothetical protein
MIADAAGIGLYGGTMLEGTVGTAASAHVFATFPDLEWGTELFGPLLLTDDIVTLPLIYADFQLQVPTAPGIGVAFDEDKLAVFRRDATKTQHGSAALQEPDMLFKVEMTVRVPLGFDPEEFERLKAKEKAFSQDLQRQDLAPYLAGGGPLRECLHLRRARQRPSARPADGPAALPLHGHRRDGAVPPPSAIHEDDR